MFSRMNKLVAVAAVAVSALSPAAFAGGPKYVARRVPMGPRPDQYVLVRVDRDNGKIEPYALTGRPEIKSVRRVVQRWSGSRYIGPMWVTERATK